MACRCKKGQNYSQPDQRNVERAQKVAERKVQIQKARAEMKAKPSTR